MNEMIHSGGTNWSHTLTVEQSDKLEYLAVRAANFATGAIIHEIEAGKALLEARGVFPSDEEFGRWRSQTLPDMDRKYALRLMHIAEQYGDKPHVLQAVSFSVARRLAAPSTPQVVRDRVEAGIRDDEKFTDAQVKEMIDAERERALAAERKAREAETDAERSRITAQAEKAKAEDLLGQVNMLKENANAVRIKAEQDAEAKAKAERQRLIDQIEKMKGDVDRVRQEAEAAAKAQAEASAQAELAKVDADVRTARRKEAEAKANVDRLREVEATQRKQIAEHQEYLSRIQNSDAEGKDLIEQMRVFDAALNEFVLVLGSLEHEHSGKVASTALSIADRSEKLAQMLMGIGRPRIVYDAEVING